HTRSKRDWSSDVCSSDLARRGVRARVAIRVNPSEEAQGGAMLMGGRPSPFGVDEESLEAVLDRFLSEPSLEFAGIHLFTGTQIQIGRASCRERVEISVVC